MSTAKEMQDVLEQSRKLVQETQALLVEMAPGLAVAQARFKTLTPLRQKLIRAQACARFDAQMSEIEQSVESEMARLSHERAAPVLSTGVKRPRKFV